ncbi:MAG: thiamine pyrophosphate-dependent dehydrogenase E1 component subunit alpha [Leptospiraceae bacterium]|nr:thiamine pyrophosphate-dependent dehydrogenase E1 component subunit alpha [Leptospiraceae bacterium]
MSDKERALRFYTEMLRIRMVEEEIAARYPQGKMRCPTHLSIGQEAAAVGVGQALTAQDLAVSTHRAHAHYLAKGGDLRAMLAEIYGKATGCSGGRGGSMHLSDPSVGFIGSTAIVGNSMPVGVGLGLSLQLQNSSAISVVYLGDGSIEEGVFYESVNFAVVRNLPVFFVCENNFYSVYSPLKVRQPEGRVIHEMISGWGLPTMHGDGNDVEEAYRLATACVDRIRRGEGPVFLELTTYRWREHCGPNYDNDIGYRTEEEFVAWKEKDPVSVYREMILRSEIATERELSLVSEGIRKEVDGAFEFAERSEFPSSESAYQKVFA